MSLTEQYIKVLTSLKAGELALLRKHMGQSLDKTVHGFDLFAGLWWPLRAKGVGAPRRKVAWLIAKLYAFRPIPHRPGRTLPRQLGRWCNSLREDLSARISQRFDRVLILSLDELEPSLQWALNLLASNDLEIDWVSLTDDLSIWERESTRLKWSEQFLKPF